VETSLFQVAFGSVLAVRTKNTIYINLH